VYSQIDLAILHFLQTRIFGRISVMDSPILIKKEEKWSNGKLKTQFFINRKNVINGLSRWWDEKGRPIRECVYYKGLLHGREIIFYDTGKIHKEHCWTHGKKDGIWRTFSEIGILLHSETYVNDIRHGDAEFYDGMGRLLQTDIWENGKIIVNMYYD
jgi:antitoxin component YwqK of YwqJK toxin-antitoxin module